MKQMLANDRVIYKFVLKWSERQTFKMPKHAKIRHFQTQNTFPCIWAELSQKDFIEERTFLAFATGEHFRAQTGKKLVYIGMATFDNTEFYHFYEEVDY